MAIKNPKKYDRPLIELISIPKPKLMKYYMRKDIRGYLSSYGKLDPINEVIDISEKDFEKEKGKGRLFYYLKNKKKIKK